jgi:hypothetical protein
MTRTVIHIGSHKTASTTLQRRLFARSKDLGYLGEDCENYENYRDTLNSMVSDDDIYFAYESAKELFDNFVSFCGDKTALYSNEDIVTSRVPTQCALRLKEFLPDAEIILVIRNQLTAIPSMYANHGAYLKMVPRRYWRRYVSFDDWMGYSTEFIKYSALDGYFYNRISNIYASLFGKEKIHILLYEDLLNKREKFINELCKILRIDAGEASRLLQDKRERRRNTSRELRYHQFRSSFLWNRSISQYLPYGKALSRIWKSFLAKGEGANGFIPDYWKNKIIELYREDNLKLLQEYQLSLKDYGYPLP